MDNLQKLPQETLCSVDALANYLEQEGVSEEAVKILKEEGVTGRTLPDITEEDLKELAIKIGPRKRILQIINASTKNTAVVEVIDQDLTACQLFVDETLFETPSNKVGLQGDPSDISSPLQVECSQLSDKNANTDNAVLNYGRISIRSWVMSHPQGPALIPILDSGAYGAKDRALFVRILCARIIKDCNSAYPTAQFKEEVAMSIIADFPALRSHSFSQGHEHFYDKNSGMGFLEYRLKTIRKTLSPSKKRRRTTNVRDMPSTSSSFQHDSEDFLGEQELEEKIMWMKLKPADPSNKKAIAKTLDDTRPNRQRDIENASISLTDIFDWYPRLKDYDGEMIDREFCALYANSDTFLGKFPSFYVSRILEYTNLHRPDLLNFVADIDVNLRALIYLVEILPSPNHQKYKGKKGKGKRVVKPEHSHSPRVIPNPKLIKFVSAGEDLVEATSPEVCIPVQPYLICARGSTNSFFIKADNLVIGVTDHSMKAFDILIKMHHAFKIEYASELINFYDFISSIVMKIQSPRHCCDALNTALMNIVL